MAWRTSLSSSDLGDDAKADNSNLKKLRGQADGSDIDLEEYEYSGDSMLSDALVDQLARDIHMTWQDLGRRIGLPEIEIASIKTNCKDDVHEAAIQMLKQWRDGKGPQCGDKNEVLSCALHEMGLSKVANTLPKRYVNQQITTKVKGLSIGQISISTEQPVIQYASTDATPTEQRGSQATEVEGPAIEQTPVSSELPVIQYASTDPPSTDKRDSQVIGIEGTTYVQPRFSLEFPNIPHASTEATTTENRGSQAFEANRPVFDQPQSIIKQPNIHLPSTEATPRTYTGVQESSARAPVAGLSIKKEPLTNLDIIKVPVRIPEGCLRRLAELLGPSWRKLAMHLGFDHSDIDKFSNARPPNFFAEEMLKIWVRKAQADKVNQKQILIKALKQASRQDLSDEVNALEDETIPVVELSKLSSRLGRHWKALATYLGISSADIDGIYEDNPTTPNLESAFEMLVAWQNKKEKSTD